MLPCPLKVAGRVGGVKGLLYPKGGAILHVSSTGLWSVYSGQYGMSVEEDRDGCSVRTRCTLPKCLLATKK